MMRCVHIVTINILASEIYHSIYRDTYLYKRALMIHKMRGSMRSLMGRSKPWRHDYSMFLLKILFLVQLSTPSVDLDSYSIKIIFIFCLPCDPLEMNFNLAKNMCYYLQPSINEYYFLKLIL